MKYALMVLLGLSVSPVWAGNLKAIVNDAAIFEADVNQRSGLLKAQQPSVYGAMTEQDLQKASLENLIEETLKAQKAQAMDIQVSEADIDKAILHLEQQNGFSSGGLKKLLQQAQVPEETLRRQVFADLMWLQYVRSQIQPPQIPDSAVRARLDQIRHQLAKPSFNVAEILVPTLAQAQEIWDHLQTGADFNETAQRYSKASSATAGGYVGMIEANHYGKEIASIMQQMPVGQLSRPLATPKGYLILLMLDKKSPIQGDDILLWEVAQGGLSEETHQSEITQTKNCADFEQAIKTYGVAASFQRGWTDPIQLPVQLKEMLKDTVVGDVLGPVKVPQGQLFFMKCSVKSQRVVPSFEEVKERLEMEQMEVLAKGLLKAEKRGAVIEYK